MKTSTASSFLTPDERALARRLLALREPEAAEAVVFDALTEHLRSRGFLRSIKARSPAPAPQPDRPESTLVAWLERKGWIQSGESGPRWAMWRKGPCGHHHRLDLRHGDITCKWGDCPEDL